MLIENKNQPRILHPILFSFFKKDKRKIILVFRQLKLSVSNISHCLERITCLQNSNSKAPVPSVTVFGDRAFREGIKVK